MNAIVLLALVAGSASALDADDKSWQKPIAKVIGLLKDMETQLTKEAEEDAEMFEKYACWCETNDAEKTKAIADAEKKLEDLTALIEELTAQISQLKTEIEDLDGDIAKNQKALDTATAQREKEKGEFEAQEADLKEALAALKQAIDVLQKVQLMQKQGKANEQQVGQTLLQVRNIVVKKLNLQ